MPSIRISETEILDAKHVQSFKASEKESPDGKERVLTITRSDGQDVTLTDELADNALAILRLHGF